MTLVGFGSRRLEAPSGTPLGGYVRRTKGCIGSLDPLEVHVMSIATGGVRALLAVCDLVAIPQELAREVRAALAHAWTGRPAKVIVAATHTHAAPDVDNRPLVGRPDPDRTRAITHACAAAAAEAVAAERTATVDRHVTEVNGVGGTREPGGSAHGLPVDMLVSRDAETGALLGVMAVLPCHPTVLDARNLESSADLHGAVRHALRERLAGADTPATVLANGAAGDVSTRPTRQARDAAELGRLGAVAADGIAGALAAPGQRLLAADEEPAMSMRSRVLRWTTRVRQTGTLPSLDVGSETTRHAEALAEAAEASRRTGSALPAEADIRLELLRIGDLAVLAVPGELYLSLGERLRGSAPYPLLLGYAGGYVGYLPTRDAYSANHYGSHMTPWAPGVGEALVETGQRLLAEPVRGRDAASS